MRAAESGKTVRCTRTAAKAYQNEAGHDHSRSPIPGWLALGRFMRRGHAQMVFISKKEKKTRRKMKSSYRCGIMTDFSGLPQRLLAFAI